VAEALEPLSHHLDVAFIFGSVARGNNPFVSEVLPKKKIFLIGDEHGPAELGRHKP
jgi:hypothetical protein